MDDSSWQPLSDILVVDLTRYIPGPFASRELLLRGARVVRLEAPEGDPLRRLAPGWHHALNAGKESVVCDLKAEPEFGRALCSRADVILEGFRPGVAERLGIGIDALPETAIYCTVTGFGWEHRYSDRAGHDLNYLGFAGALADTAPYPPPLPIADLAAGAQAAVNAILLALYDRAKTGRGRRIDISMTHQSHHLVAYRLGGDGPSGLLTGQFACYRIYPTADGRYLTVAAIEPKFFRRVCELIGRTEISESQFDVGEQERLMSILTEVFEGRPLQAWLDLFQNEDVAVGPVNTLPEAAADFGVPEAASQAPEPGEHTDLWRAALTPRGESSDARARLH